jgi:hypothetical protein
MLSTIVPVLPVSGPVQRSPESRISIDGIRKSVAFNILKIAQPGPRSRLLRMDASSTRGAR